MDETIHWIVVLGGGHAQHDTNPPNDLLTGASVKRLLEGIRLYKQLPNAKLILSGGRYRPEEVTEADRMRQLVNWFNIKKEDVVLEPDSINTADEAKFLKHVLMKQPFYLVTSAVHMPRSMAIFNHKGLNPIAAPTDFTYVWQDERWERVWIPNASNLQYLSIVWHELLGLAWAKLNGFA